MDAVWLRTRGLDRSSSHVSLEKMVQNFLSRALDDPVSFYSYVPEFK